MTDRSAQTTVNAGSVQKTRIDPVCEVTIRIASAAEDRVGALDVRRAVFVREQGVPEELEMDDLDDRCLHLVAIAGGEVIGTARLFEDAGCWHVGRVAVLPEWRQRSVGTLLMQTAEKEAAGRGARGLFLNAQIEVIPFYERLGYVAEGDPFLEAGIWHRSMRLVNFANNDANNRINDRADVDQVI